MDKENILKRFEILKPLLNERLRRQFAAAEAMAIGHGGITLVFEATGSNRRKGFRFVKRPLVSLR